MGTLYSVDASTGNITTAGSITSTSTTSGFLLPRLTTTQRNAISSPSTGLEIFNLTTNQVEFYNGSVWGAVGGGSGTVNPGTLNELAYYSASSATISGSTTLSQSSSGLVLGGTNIGISNTGAYGISSNSLLSLSGSPFVQINSDLAIVSTHNIILHDDSNSINSINIKGPTSNVTATYTLRMPTTQGGASTFLQNDGSGNLSWAAGSGTVTGSGSTNSIPVWTSSTAIGNSGLSDNGITLSSASRLFSISYPGNTLNPTTQYQLFLTNGSVRAYTYENFFNQFTFASATTIATIGDGFNASADVTVFGNGFSGNTRSFVDKVIVCCNGNTASAVTYATTSTGSPIARTYTATASGGTITLTIQMSGNAAIYQASVLMTALWNQ